jgi:hypothetical protein
VSVSVGASVSVSTCKEALVVSFPFSVRRWFADTLRRLLSCATAAKSLKVIY